MFIGTALPQQQSLFEPCAQGDVIIGQKGVVVTIDGPVGSDLAEIFA